MENDVERTINNETDQPRAFYEIWTYDCNHRSGFWFDSLHQTGEFQRKPSSTLQSVRCISDSIKPFRFRRVPRLQLRFYLLLCAEIAKTSNTKNQKVPFPSCGQVPQSQKAPRARFCQTFKQAFFVPIACCSFSSLTSFFSKNLNGLRLRSSFK